MGERTLLDAILEANAAAARGEPAAAALPPGAYPFVITCMDPRLVGTLIPALGLSANPPPQAKFAGAIIRPGDVAGARSVLAAAIFNVATEVLVVGHTDCRMGKTSTMEVRNGLARLGVGAAAFGGEDPPTWLGAFTSERQSVASSVASLRADPKIPPAMPVHGLLYNLGTRRLEVVVRGYDRAGPAAGAVPAGAGGYSPGPASFDAPPAPTFGGTPVPAPGFSEAPAMGRSGPVSFGAAPPIGAPPPPLVPPGGMPPPSFPEAPSMTIPQRPAPDAVRLDTPSPPLPPPPPPSTAEQHARPIPPAPEPRPRRRGKSRGDSPFDRAKDTLDRLRREKGR